ncbi:hypothetical protein CC77DRAFT_218717 [Alternaria alternata]|uniref:Uncharacterized protein n=1 Tax=Alternaria alternata TaxID=5599 RepID=A0A177DHD1_ALTAL|nr:hypothetical protein CC77DRAFT_218717 [Alternaria alternata]OAG18239.1 hypothetical protein CC77DRAFT_218717 [Alternaria alternata]
MLSMCCWLHASCVRSDGVSGLVRFARHEFLLGGEAYKNIKASQEPVIYHTSQVIHQG